MTRSGVAKRRTCRLHADSFAVCCDYSIDQIGAVVMGIDISDINIIEFFLLVTGL